ncbi:MAG: hypothetical protein M3Y06_09875 [Actinomycetota bacterium]|nr:hypothetical protein [Actinomycetota bacterium]
MSKAAAPSKATQDLATRLLDAQVAWIVSELTGPGLAELLERDVDDLLSIGESLPLDSVVSAAAVKLVLRRTVDATGDSALLTSAIGTLADAIYDLPSASEHLLGDVVDRDHVDALVVKLLSMHRLQDQAMARMMHSPAVGTVATKFVGKIVADFVQENRQRVEKLPGAKSLMSIGLGAANKVRSATQDTFIGDAAGRGAHYAIKRTNSATRELIREAPLREAALELWDLQAAEPMSDLRSFLTSADLREIAQIVRALIVDARTTDYTGDLIDACVDAVFESYGSTDVTALLVDLGVGRDDLIFGLQQLAPVLLDALRENGALDTIVRDRLAPFFESPALVKILDRATKPGKPKPTKDA